MSECYLYCYIEHDRIPVSDLDSLEFLRLSLETTPTENKLSASQNPRTGHMNKIFI